MKIFAALICIAFTGMLLQAQQAADKSTVAVRAALQDMAKRFPPELIIDPNVNKLVPGPICIYRSGPEGKIVFENCRPGSSPSEVKVWITPKPAPPKPPEQR